jgi:hypothetical protein
MAITKKDLAEKIKRRLGYPMVKVELDPRQIDDAIDYARDKFIKWAVSQATAEVYFTCLLSAGQNFYDLPVGVTEVLSYDDKGSAYGINTLFTIDNFLYNRGVFDPVFWTAGDDYTLISYHIALDFLSTVKHYTPTVYNWKYHRFTNQLEIHPTPPSGNSVSVVDQYGKLISGDSPGYVLLRTHMIEGSQYANTDRGWSKEDSWENFYTGDWIFDYALAECKIMLGRIRMKFAQFASIGNVGIALDGDTLLSEGIEEKRELKETLQLEENWEGYPILIGY